jgi:hypothetical protein
VSGKSKLGWGIAVAAIAVAAFTLRGFLTSAPSPRSTPREPGSHVDEDAGALVPARTASAPVEATRNATTASTDPGGAPDAAGRVKHPGTLLHVRVVDGAHRPLTSGRLIGLWSEDADQPFSPQTRDVHHFELAIAGATTDVALPGLAASALLAASVERQPPSIGVPVFRLHGNPGEPPPDGTVERDVEIGVDSGVASPRLSGRILVDGQPSAPRGLAIGCTGAPDRRVHALDARYEIGPMEGTVEELFITSDETVPRSFQTGFTRENPPKGDAELDLDLASGVTLRLNVVDRKFGAPLPGIELWVRVECVPVGAKRDTPRYFEHHVVAGPEGVALVRGLPRGGDFSIRRDAKRRKRRMEMLPQPMQETELPREPLLWEVLDPASPATIERTLRIDPSDRTLHAFGVLGEGFRTFAGVGEGEVEVRFATLGGFFGFLPRPSKDPWSRSWVSVPVDESGRWRFELETGVDYRIWVEREHQRLSNFAEVRAEDGDVGPVALAPRPGTTVLLRMLRCSTQGSVQIAIQEGDSLSWSGIQIPAHGGSLERKLLLDGPRRLYVIESFDRSNRHSSTQRLIDVDPAISTVVEVDLAAGEERVVRFEGDLADFPRKATLRFQRVLANGSCEANVALELLVVDGVASDPITIDAGRYLYRLDSTPRGPAVILGVVDVGRFDGHGELTIRCELEPHAKADLGAGFDVVGIDGMQAGKDSETLFRLRFADVPTLAGVETILLPRGTKFTLLDR